MRVCNIAQKRAWQPTPVFLPGESHGQRGLVGYRPQGGQDLDLTEAAQHADASVYPPVGLIQPQSGTFLFHMVDGLLPRSSAGQGGLSHQLGTTVRCQASSSQNLIIYFPSVACGLETYFSAEIITHWKQIFVYHFLIMSLKHVFCFASCLSCWDVPPWLRKWLLRQPQ